MILGSMVDYIVERLGKRNDISSSVPMWIYWSTLDVARRHDFKEMKSVQETTQAADVQSFALVTNIKNLFWMASADYSSGAYSNINRITPVILRDNDNATFFPEASDFNGQSHQYLIDGTTVKLIAAYSEEKRIRISYSIWPTYITNELASLDYDGNKDRLILAGAFAFAYQALQMPELATYWRDSFDSQLDAAVVDDKNFKDLRGTLGGVGAPEVSFGVPELMPAVRSM